VWACGFEPTPDLIAKLERKRRYYDVTGFVVASAIARAFKRVQGTSTEPDRQKLGWILAVVENALKPSQRDGTKRSAAGVTSTAYRAKWMPAPHATAIQNSPKPIPGLIAAVDQTGTSSEAAMATTQARSCLQGR
jgi:hypothetical protein